MNEKMQKLKMSDRLAKYKNMPPFLFGLLRFLMLYILVSFASYVLYVICDQYWLKDEMLFFFTWPYHDLRDALFWPSPPLATDTEIFFDKAMNFLEFLVLKLPIIWGLLGYKWYHNVAIILGLFINLSFTFLFWAY